jgi:RNA polymerase sigma factor (sigma-70 family)
VVVSSAVSIPPFQEFLDENRNRVYRFCVVAVGPADADDCFQETFLAALRAYPDLTDGDLLDRWILRIASRKAIDHHRRRARAAIPTLEIPERGSGGAFEVAESDGRLWEAVRALPAKQRVAVVHRHVLDRGYGEIAEIMGTSQEAARANVHEGMKKLRELVKR